MIGQTTNQANNPPKDGAILPPTIDVDKHELTEQELADMTPMRLAERIQQMEEAFKLLGPVEDVLNRIKCLEKMCIRDRRSLVSKSFWALWLAFTFTAGGVVSPAV